MLAYAIPRSIIFILLAIVFAVFGYDAKEKWMQITMYSFSGLDLVWGLVLMIAGLRKSKKTTN